MIGLIAVLGSLICSAVWVLMLFSGNKSGTVLGESFETYMFGSVALAILATVLLRFGI